MKKILTFILALFVPVSVSAELEFFLSPNGAVYDPNIWTSDVYPDSGADFIDIRFSPSIDPVPNEYIVVDSVVREIFNAIVAQTGSISYETQETLQYETDLYETLISTESPQFIEHIITSINPETEIIIEEKIEQNIVLTPFEETFYNCNISLDQRQEIVADVLVRIGSGEIKNLENITYSNPSFGDCIIPFPDISRRETVIENSFTSNQLLAETILGEQTRYEVHESIENIMMQESEFRESTIENEIFFSQLLVQNIITQDQYTVYKEIQSYYHNILNDIEVTSDFHKLLSEEYLFVSEDITYYSKLLENNLITQETYNIYLEEIQKLGELQKYFLDLLLSGKITSEEYRQYIDEGESYMRNNKNVTEKYIKNEYLEDKYQSIISTQRDEFEERYGEFSRNFSDTYSYEKKQNNLWKKKYIALGIISLCIGSIFIYANRKRFSLGKE